MPVFVLAKEDTVTKEVTQVENRSGLQLAGAYSTSTQNESYWDMPRSRNFSSIVREFVLSPTALQAADRCVPRTSKATLRRLKFIKKIRILLMKNCDHRAKQKDGGKKTQK